MNTIVNREAMERVKSELARLKRVEKAYEEMLALFFPEKVSPKEYEQWLSQFDDDNKTGNRLFPTYYNARIRDVRRWLLAKEEK
jgi:hypothetical protein